MTEQRWKKEERPEQADLFGDPRWIDIGKENKDENKMENNDEM